VESRDAVDAVAVEQRQRRVVELRRALHQGFRQRRAIEKGKRRRSMQFDIHD
jgi:hypothetical protein